MLACAIRVARQVGAAGEQSDKKGDERGFHYEAETADPAAKFLTRARRLASVRRYSRPALPQRKRRVSVGCVTILPRYKGGLVQTLI